MVKSRSEQELKLMQQSGFITARALKKALGSIKVGITGLQLDQIAEGEIKQNGGLLAFPTVDDYKWSTCITVNEQVVHGIPTDKAIQAGDIVSIDVGAIYKGWFTDAAWSILIPSDNDQQDQQRKHFLQIGEDALWAGIKQAVDGNRIGDISAAIQQKVELGGYSVVRSLIGHGVGKELHEAPEVPGYGKPKTGMILKEGMTIAIEVIYNEGSSEVVLDKDGWTIISADGSMAGLFEMSVVIGKKFAKVLTDWRKI